MKQLFTILFCALTLSGMASSEVVKVDSTRHGGVGLTLSGGGAKGLYHVGIIKALEENDIPIDYVSGASMGAIVGALYAAGWSPERMWNFFLTDSVSGWLSGKIPDKYQGYYRRFEPTPEMVGILINPDSTNKKSIFQLPTNIIPPYMIDLAFIDLLGPASAAASNHFDSLMVPFRCVATDIYKSRSVVFRDGSLPFAVRSSMTIPLVFKPLKLDSTLLYDGGVMNNFPWQPLVEDFAPSNLLGGVCTDNFDNPAQNDIIGQVMVMVTRPTTYALPDTTRDIIVKRVLPDIGILDYGRAADIMTRGYNDAMAMMPKIKSTIIKRRTKAEVEAKRAEFLSAVPELVFDSIQIEGLTKSQTGYVRRQLGLHLHSLFSFDYFYDKYLRIIAAGVFTGDFPVVTYNAQTGFYKIKLKMESKASIRFSLGGNISSSSLNEGYVAFNFRHTTSVSSSYGLNVSFGMFYNAINVGARHDFFSNFPFYIDYNYTYEGFDYNGSNSTPYYRNKDWRFTTQTNSLLSMSISIPVMGNSAFRGRFALGQSWSNYFEGLHTTADNTSQSRFDFLTLAAEIETSTINYVLYGTKGSQQLFSLRYVLGGERFRPGTAIDQINSVDMGNRWWVELRYKREQYIPFGSWFTLGYLVDLTLSTHPSFANGLISKITAPRFEPTPHMGTLFMTEFASSSYLGFGLSPTVNFLRNGTFYLKTYAYAFIPQEVVLENNIWHVPTFERMSKWTEFVFGGSLVYQTPVGPASMTVVKYSTGRANWNFVFNFGYTLFGKRKF